MKIQEFSIKGFRSLKDVTWKPGDLNVVIGPNCSGKSNLLRALGLISSAGRGTLSEFFQKEGGIDAVLWDSFALGIDASIRTEAEIYNIVIIEDEFDVSDHFKVMTESFLSKKRNDSTNYVEHFKRDCDEGASFLNEKSKKQKKIIIKDDKQTLVSETGSPFVSVWPAYRFLNFIRSWKIHQDFRADRQAAVRSPVLTKFEKILDPDGQNLISVLHTLYTGNREFKREVNLAMGAAFGDEFDELIFPPASDHRVQMRIRWKSLKKEQSSYDISDGTIRFLYLLAALGAPEPPALVAIDEPELGLHPSMFPIVAEFAVEASKKTQVILTTHSPEFLDAFCETKPTTTVCDWVDGETQLRTISEEELGYWVEKYTLGDLFRSGELEAMG